MSLVAAEQTTHKHLISQLSGKRNEVAHAQYAAQLRHSGKDFLSGVQTTLATLVSDDMLTFESGLSLFLSVWSRLRTDCSEIFHWLQNPSPQAVRTTFRDDDTFRAYAWCRLFLLR